MKRQMKKYCGVGVSDHAVVRYLERVKGINIDALREEMVQNSMALCYTRLGDGVYPGTTYRLVVRNSMVITCLEKRAS